MLRAQATGTDDRLWGRSSKTKPLATWRVRPVIADDGVGQTTGAACNDRRRAVGQGYIWFRPHGSKRDGITKLPAPASMACARVVIPEPGVEAAGMLARSQHALLQRRARRSLHDGDARSIGQQPAARRRRARRSPARSADSAPGPSPDPRVKPAASHSGHGGTWLCRSDL